jgi:hypothetical protein
LADEEREVFNLVRLQGMSHGEAAQVVGVSAKTVQRRLKRYLVLLSVRLGDLSPRVVDLRTRASVSTSGVTYALASDACCLPGDAR